MSVSDVLTSTNDNIDNKNNETLESFYSLLKYEQDHDSCVSLTFQQAPRIKGNKSHMAKDLALKLFPCQDITNKEKRRHCYIQYSQLLKRLKDRYEQYEKKKNEQFQLQGQNCGCNPAMVLYKKARINGNDDQYHSLLSEPPQQPITHPTAMPVQVAELTELKPFFEYLHQDLAPMAIKKDINGEYISFMRGAFYTDGRIDLCKQVVGPPHIQTLMDSIQNNGHVKHFLLGNNVIGNGGGKSIGNFLKNQEKKCRIKTWYLAGNDLGPEGIQHICAGLMDDKDCDQLWLKRNPLLVEGIGHIANMMSVNRSIRVLDLVNVACFDQGLSVLFESLKQNETLEFLYLDSNALSDPTPIVNYMNYKINSKTCGIHSLSLGINRFSDDGVITLSETLKNYTMLQRLILSSNRISRKGLVPLLDALKHLPQLTLLDLGMYKSTPDMGELPNYFKGCGDILSSFIRHNKTLLCLDLSHSHLTEQDFEMIQEAIMENFELIYVKIEQYGLRTPKSTESLKQIQNYCSRNVARKGLDPKTIKDEYRFHKHTQTVQLIDSIYRNNM